MKKILSIAVFILLFFTAAHAQEVINIQTDNTSLVFCGTPNSTLRLVHWGEKLEDHSKEFMLKCGRWFVAEGYPAFGGYNILKPALRLTHADGSITTRLVYSGTETSQADNNRTITIIRLKDEIYSVEVELKFTAYGKEDILTSQVVVTNNEKNILKIEEIASAYIPLQSDKFYLTHFFGTWGSESKMIEEELTEGIKTIDSKKGVRTTHGHNPSFLLSVDKPAEETYGQVYGGALAWSGNYDLSFQVDERNMLHITCGINSFASTINLKAGEAFTTPEMILGYSADGKGQLSRNFHDWVRRYNMAHGDQISPIILNSWEGTHFDFDEKKIIRMIDDAAELGIEMFVLDDGWFGNKYPRNADNAGLGDWEVNSQKLPRGLGHLALYAKSKGLKFGIWIEPEMVNPKSELAEMHPEWIIKSGGRPVLQERNQWVLDLSNPKVQDYVFTVFDRILSASPDISYVKWDANRHIMNAGSTWQTNDNQTHLWYEYTNGLYKVYERIRSKYPDVMIQACASGGGRIDMGSLKYHDEFWTSDNTNAVDRIFIQYGVSTFFPAKAMASHVSVAPNHQTRMILPMKFRFDVAMSGRLGMELLPSDIPEKEKPFARVAIETYKRIRPVVQFGDLYRLHSPYNNSNWASLMYVSKDKKQSVFYSYCLQLREYERFNTRLQGLDPEKQYRVTELNTLPGAWPGYYGANEVLSGEFLLKHGISVNLSRPFDSVVLLLEEIE